MEDTSVKHMVPGANYVQDSEFFEFDQNRIDNCFKEDRIWVVYDDSDGIPCYYALINKVVFLHPFEVQLRWIQGKDNDHGDLTR